MKKSAIPFARASRGFSLAEVMIALGIVASVMVGLMGMTTLSVRSVRESSNMAIQGRVAQEVINNIQMADWNDVETKFEGKTFKFDHEGFPMDESKNNPSNPPAFEARVKFDNREVKFGDTTYKRSSLRKVMVEVEYTPGGQRIVSRNRRESNIRYFTFYVANQNKIGKNG